MLKKKKIGIFTVEKKEANSTTKEDLDETVCYTDESDGDSDATFSYDNSSSDNEDDRFF